MQESNQTYFQRAMLDAQHLKSVPADYMETLVQQYPWFAKAQQLLAKKYQLTEPEKFNHQLQLAALHSLDRKELFALIEQTIIEQPKEIIELKKEETIVVAPEQPTLVEEEIEEIEKEPAIVLDFELANEKQFEFIDEPQSISLADFRMEEIKQPEIVEPAQHEIVETPIVAEQPVSQIILPTVTENKIMEQENISKENKQEKSFNGWLHQFSKGSAIHEDKAFTKKKADNLKEAKALMNEFIGNDEEDNEPDDLKVNLAELMSFSMQRHDDFVTETMAKVYVQQEKYDKAIATYEKLSLLKPEKSVFFAAQIIELKNKIQ
jgi:tetratricopeptide (TPR) repeat protein